MSIFDTTRRQVQRLLVAALTATATLACAQEAVDKRFDAAALWREAREAVQLAGSLKVHANKPTLRDGEALVITVEVPRPGYLNLLSVNPEGEATVLFPNPVHKNNLVEPGPLTVPSEQMGFEMRAGAPYGASLVAAFLTQEPVDLQALGQNAGAVVGTLRSQFAALSEAGRSLLGMLGTKSLVDQLKGAPMLAGMTTVVACATTGPCEAQAEGASAHRFGFLHALTPGIFLEPEDKDLAAKAGPLRPVYDKGLKLTKVSEGFVPRAYDDAARYCSIAYGHLIKLRPCDGSEPPRFRSAISEPAGGQLLVEDMARAQRAVMAMVKVPLSDGQYAALCDFTFNVGAGNLKRSTLLKAINAGEHHRVPFQMRRWTKAAGKEYRGLKVRREREIALYFEGSPIPKSAPAGEDETPLDIRVGEGS